MTAIERLAIASLEEVRFAKDTWHMRRAGLLNLRLTIEPGYVLSPNESADLWFLVWTYRRQIENAEVVAHADELRNKRLSFRF